MSAAAKKEVYRTASDIANRATDALNDAGIDTDSLGASHAARKTACSSASDGVSPSRLRRR